MRTRKEIARVNIEKSNVELKNELLSKGYNVLRKSKSTAIMVLWGEEKSIEELAAEEAAQIAQADAAILLRKKEAQRAIDTAKKVAEEMKKEVTIANLWRNFNRRPFAHINIKRDSFYFETPVGKKVRVSDHESWHFQLDSGRSQYSRAADFEAPDYDFVISDFEGKTRAEVVEIIKQEIK